MTTESGIHRRRSSSSASLKGCCCCLFLLLSLLLLIALAVFLILFLAVKPKKPQFDLQQVAVQYLGITNSNTIPSPATVSLNFKMWFTAVNPNKVGIEYGESRFTVMYRGKPLGRAVVPGFYQPAHSERELETTVAVDRVTLAEADAADLLKDATDNDRVELRILGDVPAKIRVMDFTSPGIQVSVDCAIAISPTKKALIYKQCGFDGLSVTKLERGGGDGTSSGLKNTYGGVDDYISTYEPLLFEEVKAQVIQGQDKEVGAVDIATRNMVIFVSHQ